MAGRNWKLNGKGNSILHELSLSKTKTSVWRWHSVFFDFSKYITLNKLRNHCEYYTVNNIRSWLWEKVFAHTLMSTVRTGIFLEFWKQDRITEIPKIFLKFKNPIVLSVQWGREGREAIFKRLVYVTHGQRIIHRVSIEKKRFERIAGWNFHSGDVFLQWREAMLKATGIRRAPGGILRQSVDLLGLATETQPTRRRDEWSRFYWISFPYFELLYAIVTFPF